MSTRPEVDTAPVANTTAGKWHFAKLITKCVVANGSGQALYLKVGTYSASATNFDHVILSNENLVLNASPTNGYALSIWAPASATVAGIQITGF